MREVEKKKKKRRKVSEAWARAFVMNCNLSQRGRRESIEGRERECVEGRRRGRGE